MKLSELYKASLPQDDRKFEVLRSDGTPSGHFITLVDPASSKAADAVFMREVAEGGMYSIYAEKNKELLKESEDNKNYTAFNVGFETFCEEIRDAFAVEVVEDWDFDNEFSKEELINAISSFRSPMLFSLQRQIINKFDQASKEHKKK